MGLRAYSFLIVVLIIMIIIYLLYFCCGRGEGGCGGLEAISGKFLVGPAAMQP